LEKRKIKKCTQEKTKGEMYIKKKNLFIEINAQKKRIKI